MAIHSTILAWRIPWTEEPGSYSPWGHKESDLTGRLTLSLFWITASLDCSLLSCLFCPHSSHPGPRNQRSLCHSWAIPMRSGLSILAQEARACGLLQGCTLRPQTDTASSRWGHAGSLLGDSAFPVQFCLLGLVFTGCSDLPQGEKNRPHE